MSDTPLQPDAISAIRDFFKDPEVSKQFVDNVVTKRPLGWSRRSNAPYYNKQYGEHMKSIADLMLTTGEPQIFLYKDFPNISKGTLYNRINQAIRFLIDKLDTPQRTYRDWNDNLAVRRERGLGIRFDFKDREVDAPFVPRVAEKIVQMTYWQQQITRFLENSSATKLHLDKLALTPEQVEEVRQSLAGLKNIQYVIRAYEIKIVKTV